jgi:pimeloyl-ACP methyl ester carboxylesterase
MWHSRTAALCACAALIACGGEDDETTDLDDSGRPAGSLAWRACGSAQCAEVQVPIDHAAPELGTLPIAINRVLADGFVPYRGVLLINRGGPGADGKSFVEGNSQGLRAAFPGFDFVGFDPRGTGESRPLDCALDADLASEYEQGSASAVQAAVKAEGERCAGASRPLFDHMGSNQVVDDIDLIRRALGHQEINFLGISYGTRLGVLYARKYAESARAVVLDAPITPSGDFVELVEGQFDALLGAHQAFFAACAARVLDCPPEPERVFESVVERAKESGELDHFVSLWHVLLTTPTGRELMAQGLREEAGQIPGAMMAGMPPAEELVPDINGAANFTIHCSDNTRAPPSAIEAEAIMARFESLSAAFASLGLLALRCGAWPVANDAIPTGPFTPRVPPLVIGGTQDILTPYAWAEEQSLALGGASLLQSQHYGHGAISWGSRCVAERIRDYLEDPRPLPAGLSCPAR